MTVQEWQAETIESAAKTLAFWITTTPEEKLGWCPTVDEKSCARCINDQIQECIRVNRTFAALLRGETPPPLPEGEVPQLSGQHLSDQIAASGKELASAVRALPDEGITKQYQTRFGPMPGGDLMRIAMGNMFYHGGQLNYIQLLYGDKEMRFPPR